MKRRVYLFLSTIQVDLYTSHISTPPPPSTLCELLRRTNEHIQHAHTPRAAVLHYVTQHWLVIVLAASLAIIPSKCPDYTTELSQPRNLRPSQPGQWSQPPEPNHNDDGRWSVRA